MLKANKISLKAILIASKEIKIRLKDHRTMHKASWIKSKVNGI